MSINKVLIGIGAALVALAILSQYQLIPMQTTQLDPGDYDRGYTAFQTNGELKAVIQTEPVSSSKANIDITLETTFTGHSGGSFPDDKINYKVIAFYSNKSTYCHDTKHGDIHYLVPSDGSYRHLENYVEHSEDGIKKSSGEKLWTDDDLRQDFPDYKTVYEIPSNTSLADTYVEALNPFYGDTYQEWIPLWSNREAPGALYYKESPVELGEMTGQDTWNMKKNNETILTFNPPKFEDSTSASEYIGNTVTQKHNLTLQNLEPGQRYWIVLAPRTPSRDKDDTAHYGWSSCIDQEYTINPTKNHENYPKSFTTSFTFNPEENSGYIIQNNECKLEYKSPTYNTLKECQNNLPNQTTGNETEKIINETKTNETVQPTKPPIEEPAVKPGEPQEKQVKIQEPPSNLPTTILWITGITLLAIGLGRKYL